MFSLEAVLFFIGLLLVATFLQTYAKKFGIPFHIILILLGFAGSELATQYFSIDTGIRWDNFQGIIFYLFLPVLIFESAQKIDAEELWKGLIPILLLALPLMLIAAFITAFILYFAIGHPVGFPWITALLAGILLSATDPAAIIASLEKTKAPKRLKVLLEGESLFNDATAVVFFTLLVAVASGRESMFSWYSGTIQFLQVFFGGITVGVIVSLVAGVILLKTQLRYIHVLINFIAAYGSYIISDHIFHFSGVMAVLAAGLIFGKLKTKINDIQSRKFTEDIWGFAAYSVELLLFLFAGVSITAGMFTQQWLAMLIGIASVIVARFVIICGILSPVSRLPGIEPLPLNQQVIMTWGGVRGTVTIALALSLPLQLESWFTVQSIAYGVVLFTLLFQTTTIDIVVGRSKPS